MTAVITGRGVPETSRPGDPDDECQAFDEATDLCCTREQGHDGDHHDWYDRVTWQEAPDA